MTFASFISEIDPGIMILPGIPDTIFDTQRDIVSQRFLSICDMHDTAVAVWEDLECIRIPWNGQEIGGIRDDMDGREA